MHRLEIVNANSVDILIELKSSRYVSVCELGIHLPPVNPSWGA